MNLIDPAVRAWGRIFRERALRALDRERDRQEARWGHQHRDSGTSEHLTSLANMFRQACDDAERNGGATWRHVLAEEVYEAFAESDPTRLRAELVQAGAVIVAWIEDIDETEALNNDN